jgi:hypothetical protein
MNKRIAQIIGWQMPSLDAAPLWAAHPLRPLTESFIRSQPEHLDPTTLRVESVSGNEIVFAVDGYASDHESNQVFGATVRGRYNVTTGKTQRADPV